MYKVIINNGSKAFQKVPEIKHPYANASNEDWKEYEQYLKSLPVIDIAPEFQDKWEEGQLVHETNFLIKSGKQIKETDQHQWQLEKFAIPAPLLEQEKEEGLDWDVFRDKFYEECIEKVDGFCRVNLTPHNLFEWFRDNLKYYNITKK